MSLIDSRGRRLYLTAEERKAFITEANRQPRNVRTFCLVLAYSGCRISEALSLTPEHFDFPNKAIIFKTLKKRHRNDHRAVPMPSGTLDTLNMVHGLQEALKRKREHDRNKPLWAWSRTTAYRRVKEVMEKARIAEGAHRCPKGLRHAYGVHAINSGIPLNMLSKWMGHASLEITSIYANALGEEQHNIASKMWQ